VAADITDLIADFIRQAEPDLSSRLEYQAQALDDLKCTNPVLGRWVDAHDVQYLLAAFDLDDDEFASNFPGMAHLKEHDRQKIIQTFNDHFEQCSRCHLKRSYDLEFTSRIESVVRQQRVNFSPQLQATDSDKPGEDDHILQRSPAPTVAEHQPLQRAAAAAASKEPDHHHLSAARAALP
jgi:hypothetical protein